MEEQKYRGRKSIYIEIRIRIKNLLGKETRDRVEGEAEQIQGDDLGCKEGERGRKHRARGKRRGPGPAEKR